MLHNLDHKHLSAASNFCFYFVVGGAGLSMFGLVDAYLAVDLTIFQALKSLHPVAFAALLAIIAAVGIAGCFFTASIDEPRAAEGPDRTDNPVDTNALLDAERLQAMLHVLRYPVKIDGVFGSQTAEIVRSFQKDRELATDGIVGPLTLEALQKEVELRGRSDWVAQILNENTPARRWPVPRLSLVGASSPT